MREKLLWMSLVYICVFLCHDMIAEMDQIASQHEPTVIFLRLSYMSLMACLARVVCVVSGALAGCQMVELHVYCWFHLLHSPHALWLSGAGLGHQPVNFTEVEVGEDACLHPFQSCLLLTATCSPYNHPRQRCRVEDVGFSRLYGQAGDYQKYPLTCICCCLWKRERGMIENVQALRSARP